MESDKILAQGSEPNAKALSEEDLTQVSGGEKIWERICSQDVHDKVFHGAEQGDVFRDIFFYGEQDNASGDHILTKSPDIFQDFI